MMPEEFAIYLAAFLSPFVQEDAAILGAVTAFLHPQTNKMASGWVILMAMFCGLVISDLWKYWIGYAGRTQRWAQSVARRPIIDQVGAKIVANPGKTLMLARFIPGTRIPAYVAGGFFAVPFGQFAFWVVASALVYIGVAWALLGTVGVVAGEKGQLILAGLLIFGLVGYAIVAAIKAHWRSRV